jgi:predicted ABC-class ATPase
MNHQDLKDRLHRIDHRGYKAYKSIAGEYSFPKFIFFIDYVQGDPFASPSKIRVRVHQKLAKFPPEHFKTKVRKIALEDYIGRQVHSAITSCVKGNRGTGKSGLIAIQKHGQEVLDRTSVKVTADFVEARLSIGLPAAGRSILAAEAKEMFFAEIPKIAELSLFCNKYNPDKLRDHVNLFEDQEFLREELVEMKLVSFIKDGSILPRETGISERPMSKNEAIPFLSPETLKITINLPHAGTVQGMGIPKGITLIVGGGYHGKTTLLKAIERGVYNHIADDGREFVITIKDAVKIRAEDGRQIEKVDISPFIQNLPQLKSTEEFSTPDASGSTSQAANIMEALEIGTSLLLIDEDTSATNFMIRDERMQELVSKEKEPITPFIDKARLLYKDLGVSSIIVIGGSGDYFDVADKVIMMDEYRLVNVTDKALEIAKSWKAVRKFEGGKSFGQVINRTPLKNSFRPQRGRKIKVKNQGLHHIQFGRQTIDLSYVEQLVDEYQTSAIAQMMLYAWKNCLDDKKIIKQIVDEILKEIGEKGLDILSAFQGHPGEFALPRKYEIAAAINRMRSLKVTQRRS